MRKFSFIISLCLISNIAFANSQNVIQNNNISNEKIVKNQQITYKNQNLYTNDIKLKQELKENYDKLTKQILNTPKNKGKI